MADVKAKVTTELGQVIGYFVNPKVENLCQLDYEISGAFVDEAGAVIDKVEFNPEVLPFNIDLSELGLAGLKGLEKGYVQRGRQPVHMTAVCRK